MGNEKKILIVEDDNFLARMLSKTIEAEGYEVIMAGSGEEGWRKAIDGSEVRAWSQELGCPRVQGRRSQTTVSNMRWAMDVTHILVVQIAEPRL